MLSVLRIIVKDTIYLNISKNITTHAATVSVTCCIEPFEKASNNNSGNKASVIALLIRKTIKQ